MISNKQKLPEPNKHLSWNYFKTKSVCLLNIWRSIQSLKARRSEIEHLKIFQMFELKFKTAHKFVFCLLTVFSGLEMKRWCLKCVHFPLLFFHLKEHSQYFLLVIHFNMKKTTKIVMIFYVARGMYSLNHFNFSFC